MTHLLRLEIMNRSGLDLRSIFKMIVYGHQIHISTRLDVINMMVSMFLLSSHGLITYLMNFFSLYAVIFQSHDNSTTSFLYQQIAK